MMHQTAVGQSPVARRITGSVLAGLLIAGTGCVSQHAYDQVMTERNELTRALDAERTNISELDRYMAELQAANKVEEAAATAFRAAVQRDQQLRRRASEDMTSLQTQVANLVSQSRTLARQVADAKRESSSLKTLVAQYKEEVKEAESFPEPSAPPAPASLPLTAELPVAEPSAQVPPAVTPNPVSPPQQMAQVTPVTPVKPPAPPRPVQTPPAPVEESWIDMIMGWLLHAWNWITGIFS